MDLQVVVRGAADPTPLRTHAEDKVTRVLERFDHMVLTAIVRIEDETGPEKHGVDKNCHIDVKLRSGDVIIKERGDDFHAAIDIACDRLKAALSREVSRNKHGIGEG